MGEIKTWVIHEVNRDVPLLISPDTMASWDLSMSFVDGTYATPDGTRPFTESSSGHPCIDLVDFPGEDAKLKEQVDIVRKKINNGVAKSARDAEAAPARDAGEAPRL